MIYLKFAPDSKRRGQTDEASTLKAAKEKIRCWKGKPKFSPTSKTTWEVTCGDTVIADAVRVGGARKRKGARR